MDDQQTRQEGVLDHTAVFDLDLDDKEIVRMLTKPIADAETHWNGRKGFNLDEVRNQNRKLWLGDPSEHLRGPGMADLYDHSARYIDNRTFIALETIVSVVGSRQPSPEVFPAQDSITSKQLAKDLQKGLEAYVEKQRVIQKGRYAARHVLLERIGGLKLYWNPNEGPDGEIITDYFMPGDILVDKDARPGENPRFIVHYQKATVEELLLKFPQSKDSLFKALEIKQGRVTQTQQVVGYKEIWFTYYKDGEALEGVCWLYEDVVLDKKKNPNWNYKDESKARKNFLDGPLKPFFPINYLNLGDSYIDHTTATEQAAKLQRVLNTRGRQIVENADEVEGGYTASTQAVTKDQMEDYLARGPHNALMVDPKGRSVNEVVGRFPAPLLPPYVLEDKYDARNEIDNIFGTPNVFRGEQSDQNTLGQDVLIQRQAQGRQEELVRCLDDMFDRYFRYLVQMMKVYYTEDHWFRIAGEDGQFDFIVLKSDKIEDGIDVRVKAGSTLPIDKAALRQTALELSKVNLIDPISLYEDLGLPNAKKRYERLIRFQTDPKLLEDLIKEDEYDAKAFMDIQVINAGKSPKLRQDMSDQYLQYYREWMMSGEFDELKPEIQQAHQQHLTMAIEVLRQKLLMLETQMPTPEEQAAGNEKEVMMAQQAGQIMQSETPPQPGMKPKKSQGTPPNTPGNAQQSPVV